MSLVLWYELKQDIYDKTKYKHHPTDYHNVEWKQHGSTRYSYFNNSYIKAPNSSELNTASEYKNKCISLIFNPQNIDDLQVLYKQGSANIGLIAYIYDGHVYIGGYNRQPQRYWHGSFHKATIKPYKWFHLVMQLRDGAVFEGYLNASGIGQSEATKLSNHQDIYIGKNNHSRFHDGSIGYEPYYYHGFLQELKHYNMTLTYDYIYRYYRETIPNTRIIVPKQYRSVDAHNQRIYRVNDDKNNVYLSRNFNYLTNTIGNDLVLNGCSIEGYITDDKLNISVDKGTILQDSTLIKLYNSVDFIIDEINDGMYIIYTDYLFSESKDQNNFYIKVSRYDDIDDWNVNRNRIILGIIEVDNGIIYIGSRTNIKIDDRDYYVRGVSNYRLAQIMYDLYRHNNIFAISEIQYEDDKKIEQNESKMVVAYNGNLSFTDISPQFDARFLLYDSQLIDSSNHNHRMFFDSGNLKITYEGSVIDESNIPNIRDCGYVHNFIDNEYQIRLNNNHLVLTNPNNFHSVCQPEVYESLLVDHEQVDGPASNFGFICGGFDVMQYSYITRIEFGLDSPISEYKSNLSSSRFDCCGNNASHYGYICAGQQRISTHNNPIRNIDRFSFPFDSGDTTQQGQLRHKRPYSSANNSSIEGFVCGGSQRNDIERFIFPFHEGITQYGLTLTNNKKLSSAHNCTYYGYVSAGEQSNNIDRYQFASQTGQAHIYLQLETVRYNTCGNNSSEYGFICGNYSTTSNNIKRFSFANEATSIVTSDIIEKKYMSANNSSKAGYLYGGYNINKSFPSNVISQFSFTMPSELVKYANLHDSRYQTCAIDGADFTTLFV